MLIVSSKLQCDGDIVAIIDVLVLPPKESCNNRVSFDSLKEHNINEIAIYHHKTFNSICLPVWNMRSLFYKWCDTTTKC